jgi:hypothetical protein
MKGYRYSDPIWILITSTNGFGEHLPLVDQIAICVAGIEAQEPFNYRHT